MKIAIIGSGISGLVAAHGLYQTHDITVFEAADYIGGHTNTIEVSSHGKTYAVDTGFIVFNDWTYPRFIELIDQLGVASQPSSMSFSVKCERTGLEYNGTSFNQLFAQRLNLFKPSFWGMLKDIRRFNKETMRVLAFPGSGRNTSLGQYLEKHHYSKAFINHYILPMGSAIWSATRETMLNFPLEFFLKFLDNHGMLSIDDRPQWRAISGGSQAYVHPLVEHFKDRIHTKMPIMRIKRHPQNVEIVPRGHASQFFDKVIIATHSDQALKLLADPTEAEQDILSSLPYQENVAILHTDHSVLPKRKRAWAAWNYHLLDREDGLVALTYNMNILQNLKAPETFCVTLNCEEAINPAKIKKRLVYHHPIYTHRGVENQIRHSEISGVNHTYYAGAYWFNGFHEDGVRSGQRVVEKLLETQHA